MPKPKSKSKSAMDNLVDSFSDLVENARKTMSPEDFRQAEKKFDEIVEKARARACRGNIDLVLPVSLITSIYLGVNDRISSHANCLAALPSLNVSCASFLPPSVLNLLLTLFFCTWKYSSASLRTMSPESPFEQL
jgi:hypothetical protein